MAMISGRGVYYSRVPHCAIVLTYGRATLCELLACVARQTEHYPVLVYVDNAPCVRVLEQPRGVWVVHHPPSSSLGAARAAAVEQARELFDLGPDSGVMILDDDDFYSSRHFEVTTRALELAPGGWTGSLAIGWSVADESPSYVCNDAGVGQHATWAFRLGLYDEAGGYPDVSIREDVGLGYGIGWERCTPHHWCTHVKREWPGRNISGLAARGSRERLRADARGPVVTIARPEWTPLCAALEQWCRDHEAPPLELPK